MTREELQEILKKHQQWLKGEGGERANLRYASLQNASLQNANLHGANLRYASLQDADLRNADLRNADLHKADLRNADLRNADLRNANLHGADLRDAILLGAILRNASLQEADLRDADLQGANLQGANLQGANLQGADLRDANLEGSLRDSATTAPSDPYHEAAASIASLVQEKQKAYGDSFGKAGEVLKALYPSGIPVEKFGDALTVVRVVDKLFRIATDKDALGESPWKDIAGYALLSTVKAKETDK